MSPTKKTCNVIQRQLCQTDNNIQIYIFTYRYINFCVTVFTFCLYVF